MSELPRETAARTLASAFALLPEGNWKLPQMADLAARLVDCLPRPGTVPIAVAVAASGQRARTEPSRPTRWLFWLAIAVGWFFLLSYLTTSPVYDSTPVVSAPK